MRCARRRRGRDEGRPAGTLRRVAVAVAVPIAIGAAGVAQGRVLDEGEGESGSDVPSCVSWRTEVRSRAVGYNHYVIVENDCDVRVRCTIRTDVNPDPVRTGVEAGGEERVLTFRSSPARTFSATVRCDREGD